MEYYYTPKEYISQTSLTIVDEEAKHLARVLRKSHGEEIFVTDGEGNVYKTKITNISKNLIDCEVTEKFHNLNEPDTRVTLYQSLIKSPDRFEFVIEKAVELGAYCIQPIITENTINKTTDKTERWQSIALAAMKQSQRCFLPKILHPVQLTEALQSAGQNTKLISHEKVSENSLTLSGTEWGNNTAVFIGPEGGFTDTEITLALDSDCRLISLGSRKYRSETAAIAALSLLLIKTNIFL